MREKVVDFEKLKLYVCRNIIIHESFLEKISISLFVLLSTAIIITLYFSSLENIKYHQFFQLKFVLTKENSSFAGLSPQI